MIVGTIDKNLISIVLPPKPPVGGFGVFDGLLK